MSAPCTYPVPALLTTACGSTAEIHRGFDLALTASPFGKALKCRARGCAPSRAAVCSRARGALRGWSYAIRETLLMRCSAGSIAGSAQQSAQARQCTFLSEQSIANAHDFII
eukprot:6199714-Pleurochrysis_carterae.AAC.3